MPIAIGRSKPEPSFLQIRRRQIDRDPGRRDLEPGVANRGSHPVPAFPDRRIRQPYRVEDLLFHHNAGVVDLDVDDVRIDAVHCRA